MMEWDVPCYLALFEINAFGQWFKIATMIANLIFYLLFNTECTERKNNSFRLTQT